VGHFFSHFPGSSFFSIFPTFAAFIAVVFLLAEWFPTQAAGDSWLQEQPGVAEAGDPFQADTEPVLPEVLVRPDELPPAPAETPTAAPPAPTADPYNLPLSYPNLEQLRYEGLNSALRGGESIFESPRATSIIDRIQLDERQPRNMVEAVEQEVGILMQRTGAGQASPFIRGLTGPQTLLMIDGIRMNNSTFRFGPNQYFALIDPGMIERIEVVRGPMSTQWGSDAIGGAINVVTRGTGLGYDRLLGGEFINRFATADAGNYSRLNVQGMVRDLGVFSGASYSNIDDLQRGGSLGRQPFTSYSQYAGDIRFDFHPDVCQRLTVSLQHFEQQDVPRSDRFPAEIQLFNPQQRDMAYIRWEGNDLSGLLLDGYSITASYQRNKEGQFRRRPPTGSRFEQGEFDVDTVGISFVFFREPGRLGKLTWGVDWYHDDVDASRARYDVATGQLIETLLPQFPDDSHYRNTGAFLLWEMPITERLTAQSGIRFSDIQAGASVPLFDPDDPLAPAASTRITPVFSQWTANAGLSLALSDEVRLVGSVAEGFRAPLLDELTSVSTNVNEGIDVPNPDLSPETSRSYEVGLKANFNRLRGQAFVYWTDLEDLIAREQIRTIPDPLDPGSTIAVLQRRNIGQAEIHGFELAGEYLFTPQWSLYGNFWTTYGQNLTDDEPLSRIPPNQGIVGLRLRSARHRSWFELYTWIAQRQDRLSERDGRDSRIPDGGTPGYATLNMRMGWEPWDRHRISLGIENIFNEAYRVHGSGVDGPGISGHVGYEARF
jgi:iron complex outermembrane receptor protein/hemoglobin/transferrin/lactoferrin receptor protein